MTRNNPVRGTTVRARVVLVTAFAGGALALAACGGSGDSAAPATGTLITTTPGASPSSTSPSSTSPSSTSPSPTSSSTTAAPSSTTSSPAPTTGAPASNQCVTGSLSATLGQGSSGAGTQSAPLVLTNTGSTTCTIQGYPGVSYVTGDAGDQVGNPASRTGPEGSVVVLDPGASASALVLFTQVFNYPEGACQPTPVRGIRIYPPNNRDALFVPQEGTGCASTDPGISQLKVQPVTTGVTGGL